MYDLIESDPEICATPPVDGVDSLSLADVASVIRELASSEEKLTRVLKSAKYHCNARGQTIWEPEALRNEAFRRALDGSRKWPRSLDVYRFLSGVMRSIVSEEVRRKRAEYELGEDLHDESPSPEQAASASQSLKQVLDLFSDHAIATRTIQGLAAGLKGCELMVFAGVSDKIQFASVMRLIRRRLDTHFPNGWQS